MSGVLYSEFFEECIAEEQFEAKKLDIMKDALRARPVYEQKAKGINNEDIPDASIDRSEISPSPDTMQGHPVTPDQPPVTPDQPPVTPIQAPVTPDQPLVTPDQAPVTPIQPLVTPDQAPVTPDQPPVTPDQPPVTPQ